MENFLVVRIGKTKVAFNIKQIHFIIRNNGIVKLPEMPEWLEGIISYRDKVVPVINNKHKLKTENDNDSKKRILLCEIAKNTLIGINFDKYLKIEKVEKTGKTRNKITIKTGKEVIPVIDIEQILTEEEIEFIKKI